MVFRFFLWVHLRNGNFPRKPCGVSSFFVPTPSQKPCWRFKVFFVHPETRSFPANHEAFQVCFCVNLHTLTLLKKPCGFSKFCVALRTTNSPRKLCIVSYRFTVFWSRGQPPRTFPAHHVPFRVFALLFKATAFRNLKESWKKRHTKHLMKPNTLAQSSSHALADKGWPGRWHHSTTLCSPMQKIRFGPMCSPPCSASWFPAPPSFLRFLRLPYAFRFAGNLPGSAATGASLFYYMPDLEQQTRFVGTPHSWESKGPPKCPQEIGLPKTLWRDHGG